MPDTVPIPTLECDANTTCTLDSRIYMEKTADRIYPVLHNIGGIQFQSIMNVIEVCKYKQHDMTCIMQAPFLSFRRTLVDFPRIFFWRTEWRRTGQCSGPKRASFSLLCLH